MDKIFTDEFLAGVDYAEGRIKSGASFNQSLCAALYVFREKRLINEKLSNAIELLQEHGYSVTRKEIKFKS